MQAVKDASALYEVEHRAIHAERPGFRITELQIGPKQKVPWHCHSNVQDTFYVLAGKIRIFLSPRRRCGSRRARPTRSRPSARISSPTGVSVPRYSWCCRAWANTISCR